MRDDAEAARVRAEALARELAERDAELEKTRQELERHEKKDVEDEKELARLRKLAREPGTAPLDVEARMRSDLWRVALITAAVVAGCFVFGLVMALAFPDPDEQRAEPFEAPPSATAGSPRPEPGRPVDAHWRATVLTSDRADVGVATACEVDAELRVHDSADAEIETVRVTCGSVALYDARDELGTSFQTAEWEAHAEPGVEQGTWVYTLRWIDQGQRSGPRAQIQLDSRAHGARIWSQGIAPFSVTLAVEDASAQASVGPLSSELPTFAEAVRLELVVRAAPEGHAVHVGDTCTFTARTTRDGAFDCRLWLACGATVLYGAGTSGWSNCQRAAQRLVSVDDPSFTDGDPQLSWSATDDRVTVTTADSTIELGLPEEQEGAE